MHEYAKANAYLAYRLTPVVSTRFCTRMSPIITCSIFTRKNYSQVFSRSRQKLILFGVCMCTGK